MLQDGLTALHHAAVGSGVEVINLLVKHGAAVDIAGGKVLNFILLTVALYRNVHTKLSSYKKS